MRHARDDYNRIQDPEGIIPTDEPVFLLRAQDRHAPEVVSFWADVVEQSGADEAIVEMARAQADAMEEWQRVHGSKVPDLPEERPGA